MSDISEIKTLLFDPHRAALTLHERPDGDSIGSNLALAKVLRQLGSSVDVYSIDTPDEKFSFLSGFDQIKVSDGKIPWENYDIFWALDMSSIDRNNRMGKKIALPVSLQTIVLDHHRTNLGWGRLNIVEDLASTTTLLYKLFIDWGIKIEPELATALFVGLATDTSFFQNDNTSASVFKMAQELLLLGVDYEKISFELNRQLEKRDVAFYSALLSKMQVNLDKKVAYIAITHDEWIKYKASPEDYDYIKEYLKKIKGTDLGIMFTEEKPGYVRLGLRSRDPSYDVAALAQKFGGGGHKAASGASITGLSLDETVKKVLELV